MRLIAAVLALVVAGAAMAQAPKHTITHEDVWRMKRAGQPAVSPDGAWVVFPVSEPAYDDKEVSRDLWLVPTDGSAPPRRLTSSKRGESDTQWSPDGRQIAFATRREDDEEDQIYVLDVHDGGEAQRVTKIESGAGSPKWRPDGKAILFVSNVFPGATDEENAKRAKERKDLKYKARVYDASPIRFWDRWMEDTRPALFVQTLGEGGKARNLFAGTQFARQAGFGGQLGDDGENLNAEWTPDGSGIVFGATVNRNEWTRASNVIALWHISADGGEPQRLTADQGTYGSPTFSRDGRALFATLEPANGKVYNNERLVRWTWTRGATQIGEPKVLTPGFDRSVGDFVVTPDGSRVFLLAEDAGHEKLYRVNAAGGDVTEVGKLESGCFTGLVGGAKGNRPVLVANWESSQSPNNVGVLDASSGKWRALSKLHDERTASHRLAAGAGVLVPEQPRHAHPQLPRAAAELRSEQEVSAVRRHPRRAAQHVAGPVRHPLELPPARRAGLRGAADELLGLDGVRRCLRADDPGRSAQGSRDGRQRSRGRSHQALFVHRRLTAGRGRRELRRPSHQLARRFDHALQGPRESRRAFRPEDAVDDERFGLRPRAQHGRPVLGRRGVVEGTESR